MTIRFPALLEYEMSENALRTNYRENHFATAAASFAAASPGPGIGIDRKVL